MLDVRNSVIVALYGAVLSSACIIDWDRVDPANRAAGGGPVTLCEPGDTQSCYSGPDGTRGVGICVGGTATCVDDGSGFGPCEGETLPSDEDCDTPEDDDCDGLANPLAAGCPCVEGTLYPCYDGPEDTAGVGVCTGGQSLCGLNETLGACVGEVTPMLEECSSDLDEDCDGDSNTACPTDSAYFDTVGGDTIVWALALAPDDDIVIGGHLHDGGSIDFGGGAIANSATTANTPDGFVVRLSPTFTHRWTWHLESSGRDEVNGVSLDAAGNVYVTGEFAGTASFGGAVGDVTTTATSAAFVARLDGSTGLAEWAVQLGDAGATATGEGIDTDDAGLSVVTGGFLGDITIGANPQVSAASQNGFVLRIDAAGAISWGDTFGGGGFDRGYVAKLVSGGDMLVGGEFSQSIDFGAGNVAAGDGVDGFIVKLSSTGTQQWLQPVGSTGDQSVRDIAIDASGNVIAFGEYDGVLDAGAGAVPSAGDVDILAVKLGSDGSLLWSNGWGGEGDQSCGGVTTTTDGDIWLGVSHELSADYGGGLAVRSAGDDDWVLVKLDGDANHVRTHRYGNGSDQDPRGLGVDSLGNLISVGDCTGVVDFGAVDPVGSSTENVCIVKQPQ